MTSIPPSFKSVKSSIHILPELSIFRMVIGSNRKKHYKYNEKLYWGYNRINSCGAAIHMLST